MQIMERADQVLPYSMPRNREEVPTTTTAYQNQQIRIDTATNYDVYQPQRIEAVRMTRTPEDQERSMQSAGTDAANRRSPPTVLKSFEEDLQLSQNKQNAAVAKALVSTPRQEYTALTHTPEATRPFTQQHVYEAVRAPPDHNTQQQIFNGNFQ